MRVDIQHKNIVKKLGSSQRKLGRKVGQDFLTSILYSILKITEYSLQEITIGSFVKSTLYPAFRVSQDLPDFSISCLQSFTGSGRVADSPAASAKSALLSSLCHVQSFHPSLLIKVRIKHDLLIWQSHYDLQLKCYWSFPQLLLFKEVFKNQFNFLPPSQVFSTDNWFSLYAQKASVKSVCMRHLNIFK